MTMLNYIMLAEATHPWALGVFVFILGVSGLFLLARSGWENEKDSQSWRSQLFEAGIIICGLLVVVPILMLVPEETRKALLEDDTSYIAPHKGALVLFALVFGGGIWLFMRLGLPHLRRFFNAIPRKQRQGRPSPPGKGRRSKKGRK